MDKTILGIDIGTSGLKLCITNTDCMLIASASVEYSPSVTADGWVEQDPDDWYDATIVGLTKLKNIGIVLSSITAVGITGQMRGVTFIGSNGKTLRTSILWNDLRCTKEVEDINFTYSDLLYKITKNRINTMCSLPKLLWVKKNQPTIWEKTAKILYPKDYLRLRLIGKISTDLSDASGSSLFDLKTQKWSSTLTDLFEIDRNKLPQILNSSSIAGYITKKASEETGLQAGVPVVSGGSDATVESFALGLTDNTQCKIRLGSSGAISTITEDISSLENRNVYCWSYILENSWMLDTNTRSCAQSVKWARQVFYSEAEASEKTYDRMDFEANSIGAGSDGLIFHPHLLGEDAPYWNANLSGCFTGIKLNHTRAHFMRAVYEGTAFALRDAMSVFNDGKGFNEYILTGGGVKSDCWLSIVCDVLGISARVAEVSDAAIGAAMIASVGAGYIKNLRDVSKLGLYKSKSVGFNIEQHDIYSDIFEKYKKTMP